MSETVDPKEQVNLNLQIKAWREKAEAIRKAGLESRNTFDTLREGYGTLKTLGGGVESITQALDGNRNAWQTVTGIVDGFIQVFEGIKAVVSLINEMTAATKGHTAAKAVESATTATATATSSTHTAALTTETAVIQAKQSAEAGEAITGATAAGASLPFPANLAAIASGVASVLGALSFVGKFATGGIVGGSSPTGDKLIARVNSGEMILNKEQQARLFAWLSEGRGITPFANGGIVSGPTVGLIGEYTGASHNPEVVASLDKLSRMFKHSGEPVIIGGTLRASGRDIVCLLANETRITSKSGKRTNIKL